MMVSLHTLLKVSDIVLCDGSVIECWNLNANEYYPLEGNVLVIEPTTYEVLYAKENMQVDLVEGKAVINLVDACNDVITRTYEFLITKPITPEYMTRKLIGAV